MTTGNNRVLSGMRATSRIHLGNYFGAAAHWLRMQDDYDCAFFVADLHALTTHHDAEALRKNVPSVLAHYLALGLDPDKCTLYIQSDVPEISELYLLLNMFAHQGELKKTATFKEKARRKGQSLNAGLLTYPVLMAADILIHRAQWVPVGKDQQQHLEMTRTFAKRFNHTYNCDFLPEPQAFSYGDDLVKIYALDGSGAKMSKSDANQNNVLYLSDDEATIRKKIKKAKTDSGPQGTDTPLSTELYGLFHLLQAVEGENGERYAFFREEYRKGTIRYGDFKKELAEQVVSFTQPIRQRILEWEANTDKLKAIAAMGAEKARETAKETLDGMHEIMGIDYFGNNH